MIEGVGVVRESIKMIAAKKIAMWNGDRDDGQEYRRKVTDETPCMPPLYSTPTRHLDY